MPNLIVINWETFRDSQEIYHSGKCFISLLHVMFALVINVHMLCFTILKMVNKLLEKIKFTIAKLRLYNYC